MRPRPLMLAAITRCERHQATAAVADAIMAAGGWLVDSTQFSNLAMALRFVLPAEGLTPWAAAVAGAGVRLDEDSRARLVAQAAISHTPDTEITAALNLTFLHDEPDLRQTVPAIPG
ncbi:hypothetical protein [Nitrospirillum sp. BR 11828]|uniref:hypothetical protein n=1 Tax=Nitrospirillum sp. BR 11828 TaxID=3104325 RepID=UPI002ACA61C9|nr:hypothetical protein [Nitrospirillum sp. BR 11828]MDZ5649695.1 hypothetical protein [Nitrospirillum sp. BR 11828]